MLRGGILFLVIFFSSANAIQAQGLNHNWLIGYLSSPSARARINITDTNTTVFSEVRKMPFYGNQANISDSNGNLIISTNGIWVADATNDTMLNGAGLNPNPFSNSWPNGIPYPNANVILPMPGDSEKYILVHQTRDQNFMPFPIATDIFYSIIDISKNNGLGEVTSKNNSSYIGRFGWGIGACKHGNGRDWWIIALSDSGRVAHKLLLTPNGLNYYDSQPLNVTPYLFWSSPPVFSPDGNRFAFTHYDVVGNSSIQDVRLMDFDRCSGIFSNEVELSIPDSIGGLGVAFSSNSKFLYACSWLNIYQFNTDSIDVESTRILVAQNDTFYSPQPPFWTDFWTMYLAANGKIYITSGNGVEDIHFINYPDSSGLSCDVQQHALHIPTINLRTLPFHPNYYLGAVNGSICDSLNVGIEELSHEFNFKLWPNPNDGSFKISYLLPQNQTGELIIYDATGREVYSQLLPAWSTLQNLDISNSTMGVYFCSITSSGHTQTRKLILTR